MAAASARSAPRSRRPATRTAVIGNGDGSTPDDELPRYRRYDVGGLMNERGTVNGGQVDRDLLEPDPDAPFGLRLDNDAVVAAFQDAWQDKSVVMVEGSDLLRAVASRPPSVRVAGQQELLAGDPTE